MMDRKFDCRANWSVDDQIEDLLEKHFENYNISPLDVSKNFAIYARRIFLKRFMAHYELFCQTIDLPGDIIEFGVYRGATLMEWANFLEIRNMGDRQKQVFGFDNFKGFTEMHEKDGAIDNNVQKNIGGFDSSNFEQTLCDAISIYDQDRFIPYKPRVKLVKGNIEDTLPKFVEENPGLKISLIHFDCDLYTPTKLGLELLYPLVSRGGVILFDEYGIRPWGGETTAVDEYFADKDIKIKRFDWTANPGGYIIKP